MLANGNEILRDVERRTSTGETPPISADSAWRAGGDRRVARFVHTVDGPDGGGNTVVVTTPRIGGPTTLCMVGDKAFSRVAS